MRTKTLEYLLVGSSVLVGFIVGYGVGQETKKATADNVKTDYDSGVVTITANIAGALKDGINGFIDNL